MLLSSTFAMASFKIETTSFTWREMMGYRRPGDSVVDEMKITYDETKAGFNTTNLVCDETKTG